MNLKEACQILELSETATPEEAKKQYRNLSKKYHPDVNKAEDATDRFKKINEAYQCVKDGKGNDPIHQQTRRSNYDPFNPFGNQREIRAENIVLNTTISFSDSILGLDKHLSFKRNGKCVSCNGQGEMKLNNGCTKCKGKGEIHVIMGPMISVSTCDKCYGRMEIKECLSCNSKGIVSTDVSISVKIPGGISSGNILRLSGLGNFAGQFMGMDRYTDAYLNITVISEEGLKLENDIVVSTLQLTLLEALQGCDKTVKTVLGNKEIKIKPMSRNHDEVIIPQVGINRIGNQKVILDVVYPKNITKLIDTLSQNEVQ